MSNLNVTKIKDDADVATPAPAKIWAVHPRPAPRETWDTIAARYLLIGAGAALGWWAAPEWAHQYVTVAALGLGTLAAAKHVFTDWVAGVPVRAWHNRVQAEQIVSALGMAAIEDARRELPSSISSYNPSMPAAPKALSGPVVDAPEVTVLPNVGPLPPPEWLARLDAQPHAIFAAKTKGGKSTMAKYGMQPRIARGEAFFVIDPHSNGWLDLPSVGGGLRWNEVADAIAHVTDVYRARQDERRRYLDEEGAELAHDYFPRLNVILDEANEARSALDKRVWEPFLQVMGSGARKVGISLWLIAQSALIKNLGGSTVMRRNFTVMALDHATIAELIEDEEPNKQRRDLILARIAGQDFPACMVDNAQAYLLDRAGIDRAPIQSARALAWQPRKLAVAASVRPNETARASVAPQTYAPRTDGRTDEARFTQDKALAYLRWFVRQGKTRDMARAWFDTNGLDFQNSLYTEARRLERKQSGS